MFGYWANIFANQAQIKNDIIIVGCKPRIQSGGLFWLINSFLVGLAGVKSFCFLLVEVEFKLFCGIIETFVSSAMVNGKLP